MLHNYFRIAWRNINKHRLFSFINIGGLAIGIATFWMIALYVTDEWSYDRSNKKADRVFRVAQHGKFGNSDYNLAVTSLPYGPALKADYPEVEDVARIDLEGGGKIINDGKRLDVGDISVTDNAIFNLFTYQFISGDPTTALSQPKSIVLTKSLAIKIFGSAAAAQGQTIQFDGGEIDNITAVIEDVPENSTFRFSALRSFDSNVTGPWYNANLYTFLLLRNPDDYQKIEAHSADFFNKHLKNGPTDTKFKMELQRLTDIHLRSHLDFEMSSNGNIVYLYVFSIIALLVLFIAMINYVNLTTARASVRIKEIGIRKVIGSGTNQLMALFFSESLLLASIATITGLLLVRILLPYFNNLSGKTLSVWQFGTPISFLLFVGFAVITGFLSGLYPALVLAGFRTIPAMKGQLGSQSSTILFRKSLVVFQFTITIVMIMGSWAIYRQINYVTNKDLGFNKSQMLTFHLHSKPVRKQTEALRQQLLQSPLIESAAAAGNPIGNNDIGYQNFNIGPDGKPAPDTRMVEALIIDEDFIPAMQIQLAAGRNFSRGRADSASGSIIVNQTLVDEMGWKEPVGRRVRTGVNNGVISYATIIGVVRDFNTYSLQHKISPMLLTLPETDNDKDNLYVRLGKSNIPAALDYLQQVYAHFDSENKVDYHFLDQNFARQYQAEQKQGSLLFVFTLLAIIIACLGLFGLVTFTAEQRVKEIGIRKVLGAGLSDIVLLLSKDLIRLVIVATIISVPLAWYAIGKWMQNFAYRTSLEWWMFAASGVIAILIAFLTVSYKSIRAGLENPAKTLKSE
jgi:putative ABC transport system permease protein